jgi:anti-sigma B factor antagonist
LFEFEEKENFYLARLSGDFDVLNSGRIKNQILEKISNTFSKDLLIDLTNVSYIDSSGLGVLIGLHKQCKLNGRKLKIFGLDKNLQELFSLTSLDKILNIYDTFEKAIEE